MSRPRHRRQHAAPLSNRLPPIRFVPLLGGLILILAGTALLWSMHNYRSHAESTARRLLQQLTQHASDATRGANDGQLTTTTPPTCQAPPLSAPTPATQARAVLSIPALALNVPILAGTNDTALDRGVGHLNTSNWPDQGGTTVLEAHDVTFFAHLPQLAPGQHIVITAPCRSWLYTVATRADVAAGTPVADNAQPTLVLVTCYPSDALFLTSQRYVTTATLTSTSAATTALPPTPTVQPVHAALPTQLIPTQLTVDSVGIPLGRLRLTDPLDPDGHKSAGGFQALGQATRLLVAAERAATEHRPDWWSVIAPTVPYSQAALIAGPAQWQTRVNVTITASNGAVTSATFTGATRTPRGSVPITITLRVTSGTMTITKLNAE